MKRVSIKRDIYLYLFGLLLLLTAAYGLNGFSELSYWHQRERQIRLPV